VISTKWFQSVDAGLKPLISRNQNLVQLSLVTAAIFIIMSVLNPELFFAWSNFKAMSFQFPVLGLLTIGVMISMLSGGIDLSIVATANLSGVIAAMIMTSYIPSGAGAGETIGIMTLAILAAIVTGLLCGLFNGFLISKVKIPEILATLGTMQLFTGIAIVLTKGKAVLGLPEKILFLGNGTLLGIPFPLFLFAFIAIVVAFVLKRTSFGYELFLMGTNRIASLFSGIDNKRMFIKSYVISGLLASLAGLLIISQANSAKADFGTSYLLQTIVIVVMGGVNPSGGFGRMSGVILSILCMQFLSSGFNMMRVGGSFSNIVTEMAWGVVLLLVMVINYFSNRSNRSNY
jgi:simple sugar transport system permease protein